MRQVIRADLDLLADPPPDLRGARSCAAREAGASQDEPGENPGTASLSASADPGLGAGERKGRGGRSAVRRRRRPRAARRLSCAATRPPPGRCAPASRCRAPRPPPRSCASTPTKARCATCASPSATPLGPAANLLSLWRDLAGRPPSLDPGRISRRGGARSTWLCRPERPRSQPEGLAQGRAIRSRRPPRPPPCRSPPSRTPQPPKPKSSRSGCSTWSSPSGCAGRGPLPLIATKILDPSLRSDGRQPAAKAGRARLAERRRRRDRARRRLRPRPRRRSFPPLRDPDRRRAQTARRNRRPKSSTSCWPRIASRPPKRRARRR